MMTSLTGAMALFFNAIPRVIGFVLIGIHSSATTETQRLPHATAERVTGSVLDYT